MANIDSKKHKHLLLQTMKEFMNVCKENDIKYVAAYGTVLGAVRHGGMIPWDDDIDVYMTRDNYERFLNLKPKLADTDYDIYWRADEGYMAQFAKFCYRHSSIWEARRFPFMFGVFVDIFPVDEITPEVEEDLLLRKKFARYYKKYIRSLADIGWDEYKECLKKGDFVKLKTELKNRYYYRGQREALLKKICAVEDQVKHKKGTMYADYCCAKTFIEKDWIENTIEVPFEDLMVTIPAAYDQYLTSEYGDYMTPPPPEQRISVHDPYFCDLDRRVSIDEARHLIEQGKN